MATGSPRLLYVVNIPRFFVSHRLALALAARERGFEVHVATAVADSDSVHIIEDNGFPTHAIPLSQHGTNPVAELKTIGALVRLYRRLDPDLLHHISIKPVIYGGIAARLSGKRKIVQAMSGLGYVFVSGDLKAKLIRIGSIPFFRAASSSKMIFQNPDDLETFVQRGLIDRNKAVLIRGSGVDETRFSPRAEPTGELPVILFAGRLLWKKGLGDFIELARRLRGKAIFRVAGYEEGTSPLNVPSSQLEAWSEEGLIEWIGKRNDMPQVYAESNVVCLPSTYGEGVPKVLIEAAACARACVTTDTPGCHEIVRHNINGLLTPPSDVDSLTLAVQSLIDDPARRAEMGARGRQIVLDNFTLNRVVEETLALYQSLLAEA